MAVDNLQRMLQFHSVRPMAVDISATHAPGSSSTPGMETTRMKLDQKKEGRKKIKNGYM